MGPSLDSADSIHVGYLLEYVIRAKGHPHLQTFRRTNDRGMGFKRRRIPVLVMDNNRHEIAHQELGARRAKGTYRASSG